MIYNIIIFSSSSEEEYPDRSVRGRWWAFETTSFVYSPYSIYSLLSPQVSQPGKLSDEWQPVSVSWAQVMPLFLISAFLLICVSGNRP
ncbi:MAG: hypothetical protein NTX93_04995 [Bacteroidia bacterium]|nr:hypothetical protein [Bacteroidia bacterium]